ncbi:MAG: NAD(P)H-dependent oxidoreductase [Thermoanaerobacteraceae bacterium]|nr:NAD(P)H-dependent oxidoreductase [Thermoanaerobacteraceae bacterium]
MKVLTIFAHPNPKSFNRAVLDTVTGELRKKNAEVRVKDLYAMNFNPILSGSDFEQLLAGKVPEDIAAEQADVTWADVLIFIYPIWWIGQPAILKGWLDRVFCHGFAYKTTDEGVVGLLKGKKALLITTSGSDEAAWKQIGVMEAIKTVMVTGTLNFSGITDVTYKNLYGVPYVSDAQRKGMLEEVKKIISDL